MDYDVAIIGGGPAGSTVASLIRKYNPSSRVVILEKEAFPREHVGESQIPGIGAILDEMGVWDKVEAAGFPIKVGATYRWGKSADLWDFNFAPPEFALDPRPAKFDTRRRFTAYQVDRAEYDTILLEHARGLGVEVRQPRSVRSVRFAGDRVESLGLDDGTELSARHYVDASGNVGILRRAAGVEIDCPTSLKNIAVWDYWDNPGWAENVGVGATRVRVLSIGAGWIWFIPISPTRASVGFVCPADFYKSKGMPVEALYAWALSKESLIQELHRGATQRGQVRSTKDWSFVARRMAGPNWFLAGETAGFADPILAGGMMLTHSGAREVAYAILELDRGEHDAAWIRDRYDETQRQRVGQHIRFADFWYAGNGIFTDLQAYTSQLASESGLNLGPQDAFRYLSTGGFANDQLEFASIAAFDIASTKQLIAMFGDGQFSWNVNNFNIFTLDVAGASEDTAPYLQNGRILKAPRLVRDGKRLSQVGLFGLVTQVLRSEQRIGRIIRTLQAELAKAGPNLVPIRLQQCMSVLEVMLADGWVKGSYEEGKTRLTLQAPQGDRALIRAADKENAVPRKRGR